MRRSTSALFALLASALLPALATAQPALAPEDLYRLLSPSVWLVRSFDAEGKGLSSGSAVVTDNETLLTNCHVLRRAKRIVISNDNVQHAARLQYIDVERDLCQITARNMRAPAVTLADSDRLAVGQKVYAIGNPLGIERTLSDGLVSGLHRSEDQRDLKLIQTSAPISPGSSGGGLFDAQGRLVGITTSQTREGQNLNFAIPINWVRELATRSDMALQRSAAPAVAAASGAAPQPWKQTTDVTDADAVPVLASCKDAYRRFVVATAPKAFALNDKGQCAWTQGRVSPRPQITSASDPGVRAMELCVYWHKSGCALYAVDNEVVYKR